MLIAAAVFTFVPAQVLHADERPAVVTVGNFARAETDMYFSKFVGEAGGLAKFQHVRTPVLIEKQDVIRMNRDTLYSSAVFDLDAGPVTIALPDAGKRFMSAMVVNQDHYVTGVQYAPATLTLTRDQVGTRYAAVLLRTFVDADNPDDVAAANAMQDQVRSAQSRSGSLELPNWDPVTHKKAREALLQLAALGGVSNRRFGTRDEVDPISWLISTAAGWGGNPLSAAMYQPGLVARNDGTVPHVLTLKDVPVDAFWSITVYNAEGFMFENPQKAYSLNNVSAKPNDDGSYTIHFGGDPSQPNYLAIAPGWNYLVRLYRPRKEVIDGVWKLPEAQPVK
jgi:hypothetical protein